MTPATRVLVGLLVAGLAAGWGNAGEMAPTTSQERTDFGRLNPEAPPETSQFAFIIGKWVCKTRFMKPDGQGFNEGEATWTGSFILDGWAIQDIWVGGSGGRGTNIRSFNLQTRKWDNRWLQSGNLQWKYYEASKEGETMVMIGGEGKDTRGEFIDRNTFHDIKADSWSWRKDRSWDGGETWFEGIGFIQATRAAADGDD